MHWCEGIRSSGTGVTYSCELPCGCWELNLGLLEEEPVLLTAEPSRQPLVFVFDYEYENVHVSIGASEARGVRFLCAGVLNFKSRQQISVCWYFEHLQKSV